MERLNNLRDLMIDQLLDLHHAEIEQVNILPFLKEKASAAGLEAEIDLFLKETRHELNALEGIFKQLKISAGGKECVVMKSLIARAVDMVERSADPETRDAGLLTAIQHINHYEIASYGTAAAYAEALGLTDITVTLHQGLEAIKATDSRLTKLAKNFINARAQTHALR